MHSRIFVLKLKDSDDTPHYFEEDMYDMCEEFADYVSRSQDLTDDINWLYEAHNNVFDMNLKERTFKINKNGVESYFKENLDKLKSLCEELDYKKYVGVFVATRLHMNELLNGDEGGFHFVVDACEYNLDDFLRCFSDETFEIVESFDYHF